MSECPKNDAGHEPLWQHIGNEAALDNLTPFMSIEAPEVLMDGKRKPLKGCVHACQHCRLLYFEEIE